MTHNSKLRDIKKLVGELKIEEVQMEMIMKALKPINELPKTKIKKLRKDFPNHFPNGSF